VVPYAEEKDSLFFQSLNRNKKSIVVDLKTEEGKEVFHQLVKVSDGVFNNLRGDVPEKLGINYEALKHVNPKIVTCSLSGFGTSGPMVKEPAYDYLIQGMLGFMSLTGEPDGPPSKAGLSIIDFSTGYSAALGMMIGLYQAQRRGIGSDVDVSLLDTGASMLNYLAAWHLNKGYQPQRTADSAHPTLVPSQNFATKDGYVVVMCNKEKFFPILAEEIGRPELAADERFRNFGGRYENRHILIPILKAVFKEKSTDEWIGILKGKVPIAPVNTFNEALKMPQLLAREMIIETEHEKFGNVKQMGTPIKLSTAEPEYKRAPFLGEHTGEILRNYLSYTDEQIGQLKGKQVIM
jgi:crotonobetainyl-CoA:carnitine CoA-transferase CaiB-like acyl-CoA transferase